MGNNPRLTKKRSHSQTQSATLPLYVESPSQDQCSATETPARISSCQRKTILDTSTQLPSEALFHLQSCGHVHMRIESGWQHIRLLCLTTKGNRRNGESLLCGDERKRPNAPIKLFRINVFFVVVIFCIFRGGLGFRSLARWRSDRRSICPCNNTDTNTDMSKFGNRSICPRGRCFLIDVGQSRCQRKPRKLTSACSGLLRPHVFIC